MYLNSSILLLNLFFQEREESRFSDHGKKDSDRKLFVGGLPLTANTETIFDYFSRFGELVEAVVIEDKKTKLSRGYGFITFESVFAAEDAVRTGPHCVSNNYSLRF